ncbi:metabotropic glutamate receptor 3, partial [Elysia marginata]
MDCYFRIDSYQGVHPKGLDDREIGCNSSSKTFREPADGLTFLRCSHSFYAFSCPLPSQKTIMALLLPKLWLSVAITLLMLGSTWAQQNLRQQTCSRDQTATIQPDAAAWLGGIISLNMPGTGGYGCGGQYGSMQAYEAIRWVLDQLNKKDVLIQTELVTDYYVPGIPLGLKMKNYCLNDFSAQAAVASIFPEFSGDDDSCTPLQNNFTLGIVGPSASDAAMLLSDTTKPYNIPLVSYEATATQLTTPGMYTNFMRTISPDGPLIQVIVEILMKMKWDRTIIVYDSGVYGRSAYSDLHAQLVAKGICLTAGIMVEDKQLSTAPTILNRVLSNSARDAGTGDLTGVIFFGSPSYAQELLKAGNDQLQAGAGLLQWLFVDFPLYAQFDAAQIYQRGIISVSPAFRFMVEFEDHWVRIDENNPSPENPWFQEWFESTYSCKFSATGVERDCSTIFPGNTEEEREAGKRAVYQQDQYVEAAVMAVFTYARALRTAQMTKCGSVSGVCPALRDMSREEFHEDFLKKVDFTFTATERVPSLASRNVQPYNAPKHLSFTSEGDISDPSYFIWNYNNVNTGVGQNTFAFRRVGSYISNRLNLDLSALALYDDDRQVRLDPVPASPCPAGGCNSCLGLPADLNYYYRPGDVVINGIFSLHKSGTSPISCGDAMSANQYQYLQAMIYAVDRVNSDPNVLPNVRLGGLGIDDCSSPILGQAFLAQLERGNIMVKDQAGVELDPRTIEAYTAAHTTPLTIPLASAMNQLKRPLVGYRAGGAELDDTMKYPYYIHAMPCEEEEIKAIILMLKRFNWMYVQIIVSPEYYSHDAEMTFRRLAAKEGICIIAKHNIGTMPEDVDSALRGVGLNPGTHPVVALLDTKENRRLLEGLTRNRNIEIGNSFALITTTRMGREESVVRRLEEVANNVVSLSHQHSDLTTFQQYLRGLNVTSYNENPWFEEWFQAVHNCSTTGSAGTMAQCDVSKSVVDGGHFHLLYQVDSVINSVYAIARGLDATLTQYCGAGYRSVCSAFLTAANRGEVLVGHIKRVNFPIEDTRPVARFSFIGNDPYVPFYINQFEYDNTQVPVRREFRQIGDVNPWTQTLNLPEMPLSTSVPTCPAPCLACLYMFNHLNYWYVPGDMVIGAIFDIHYKGSGPYNCGGLRAKNGALYTEVFNFALQRINSGTASVRLNGVTLGGLSFDGCSNPPRTSAIINRVHTGMEIRASNHGRQFMTRDLISWITYDSQSTVAAASLLKSLSMPIVSPGATSMKLNDKQEFSTFFRTIPSDTVIVRGMAKFVQEMGWRYVITLNSPEMASRESRDYFRELLAGYGICITASYEFVTDGSMGVIWGDIADAETQVVAIFADPDLYIEEFLEDKPPSARVIFVANRPWGGIALRKNNIKDSVTFALKTPVISDFTNYLAQRYPQSVDNPWFGAIYEELFDCNLPGSFLKPRTCSNSSIISYADWEQDIWTLTTINAVYALADAVDRTLKEKCGAAYNGVCESFMYASNIQATIMAKMDILNFTDISSQFFEFMEREANRGFELMRYTSSGTTEKKGMLDRAGSLTIDNKAQLMTDYQGIQSACSVACTECSSTNGNLQDFTMLSGDVYIIGLFDVHKKGSGPFTCGEINDKHGLPLLEAFNFAIEYVNSRKGIFRDKLSGIRLGGIGLDTCQSPSQAANLVANIQSGNIKLTKDDITVLPQSIEAYIGPMETESTLRVADILSQLAVPQISYGATGVELLDMDRYSYFLRSVPADDKQARAVISYLKKFKYNNIQVVRSFDEIGEPGWEEFRKLALANKICVKVNYLAGERGSVAGDAESIVNNIAARDDAAVVILWMKNPVPVLEAANSKVDVREKFMFIATDKWGADPTVLTNPNLAMLLKNRKLVILDVETADIPLFDEYLETKTPDNYKRNPWFKDFHEDFQKCFWDTPSGGRNQACDKSSTIPRADHYVQDPYVLYVINAVFSVADGIDRAQRELCTFSGGYQSGLCNKYVTSGERSQEVMKGLRQVNFTDDTHQPFFYTEDGQSDRGFHIYNITNVGGPGTAFRYENVGSYNDSHFLKLDITYDPTVSASCDADGTNPQVPDCVCKFPPDLPSRYMLSDDGGRGLTLVYVGDVHRPAPSPGLGCGPINTGPDLQKLLAFFYAIHRINSNRDFTLPDSIKLDGLALDSCTHGMRLGQDVYNVLSGNALCESDASGLLVSPASIAAFIVDKDHNALPISSMLTQQRITTISPTASITQLQDDRVHPYFLSIRGSYEETAAAMLTIAKDVGWDYLSTIYTDSMEYHSAKDALLKHSQRMSTCVGEATPLSTAATLDDAKATLERLSAQVGARAVAMFVSPQHMRLLLQASQALGLTGRFAWLVPADWAHDGNNIQGLEPEIAGSLRLETRSAVLADFNDYIRNLTFNNHLGIPEDWFLEIYETIHQCNIINLQDLSQTRRRRFPEACSKTEKIRAGSPILDQDPGVLQVILAVYSAALGLNNIPECEDSNNNQDIAACLQLLGNRRLELIRDGVAGVEFDVLPQLLGNQTFRFSFDEEGKGRGGIIIKNFQASSGDNNYIAMPVGSYIDGLLTLDKSLYAARNLFTRGSWPSSACAPGTVCRCQLPMGRNWTYAPSNVFDPSSVKVNEQYIHPETGELVRVDKIPGATDRFEDTWAIIVTVLACIGAVVSFALFLYLLVMYPVRGGTSILGFMLTFGIVMLYLMVLAFVAHANRNICGIRRFGLGFVYSFVYASLLVKLVDCWRVRGKNEAYPAKYSKLGRPLGLFFVTFFLVLIQVMINAEWLVLRHPGTERIFYDDKYWPRCSPEDFYDEALVLSLCYVMVLIVAGIGIAALSFTT